MDLFCLIYTPGNGDEPTATLFQAKYLPDAGEAAAQLDIDWLIEEDHIAVGRITMRSMPAKRGERPPLIAPIPTVE